MIDSGIAAHSAIGTRVVARVNLVSSEPGVTGDPFGHGTHVAGMIGGARILGLKTSRRPTAGGSAPAVKFIDIRVLGRTGVGYTSDVLAGIDWAIANRTTYGIRVINLSLGHPVAESAAHRPALPRGRARGEGRHRRRHLRRQLRRDVDWRRRFSAGLPRPEIRLPRSPSARSTPKGTADRSDDVVAPYSSKGPTRVRFERSSRTSSHPGRASCRSSPTGRTSPRTYPQWHVAGTGTNAYLRLSGTSMATGVVSGGVALLLNAEPSLSPAQVKVALQTGARFIPSAGLIAGGTGSVDFAQSRKIADQGLISGLLSTVQNVLGLSSGASFFDTGTLIDRVYDRTGIRLLGLLDLGALLGGADGAEPGVLSLLGQSNPIGQTPANYVVWGTVAGWTSSYYVVWGTSMRDPSGQYARLGHGSRR